MTRKFLNSDLVYEFSRSPAAMIALSILVVVALCAILAPVLITQNPFDSAQLDLLNSRLPPSWLPRGMRLSCWEPTNRAGTCWPRCSTTHACRFWWGLPLSCSPSASASRSG
ncbi:hypothetical protein ACFQFQ_24950 [Sulfitobacter porphyrae]|uniref:Oligopeptide transport permease C-like N-terminal domain-containing protein n=1 Tax=Sulfitobacter porphyrae TaxID=1246864 RepID=A0ABW2B8J1_9RHOB